MDTAGSEEHNDRPKPIDWKEEAAAIVRDIGSCVASACLSQKLSDDDATITSEAYLNIETLEHRSLTVRIDSRGLTIVGNKFDDNSLESGSGLVSKEKSYETPYALLQSISPLYSTSFGGQLHQKLTALAEEQDDDRRK